MWKRTERLVVDGQLPSIVEAKNLDPRTFLSMTSVNPKEFKVLYPYIEAEAVRQARQKYGRSPGGRKPGAGRPHKLCLFDRIFITLMRMRGKSEEDVSFGMGISHDLVRAAYTELLPVITQCLETPKWIKWHVDHLRKDEDIRDYMDVKKGAVDAMVINTTKPPTKEEFMRYVRRGKGVGLNVLTVIDGCKILVYISKPVRAAVSDKKVYAKHRSEKQCAYFKVIYGDRGLFHAEKSDEVNLVHGRKKPPGRDLSDEDRAINAWINHEKAPVEWGNALIKNFKALEKIHWKDEEELYNLLQAICGLINFRIRYREEHPVDWGHKNRAKRKLVEKPKNFNPLTAAC